MHSASSRSLATLASFMWLLSAAHGSAPNGSDPVGGTHPDKLPTGAILVKGAWAGASDSVTPLPEGGSVVDGTYSNAYFGLSYTLSKHWTQRYSGPPPSDSGYYVLAQIEPADSGKSASQGHILVAAQDLFFSPTPADGAFQLIVHSIEHLGADYRVERAPTEIRIANHSFVRYDYVSNAAGLHWHVLATDVRCHVVQIVFTERNSREIEKLIQGVNTLQLPLDAGPTAGADAGAGAGAFPVCIKDFASPGSMVEGEDPTFVEQRFNSVPVRIIIDREGRVKHIHFLSAFPDQVKSITDALSRWRFRPYSVAGRPVEVETGIVFGRSGRRASSSSSLLGAATRNSILALANLAPYRRVADRLQLRLTRHRAMLGYQG
jgi:hypothetical protein